MATTKAFSKEERSELMHLLMKASYRTNLRETYAMGYFVFGAANHMSITFGREISRREVVREILKLKDHLEHFMSFIKLPGVGYMEEENVVFINHDSYFKKNTETPQMRLWRIKGEQPLYLELHHIFIHAEADHVDYGWFLRSFQAKSEGLWLTENEDLPQMMMGIESSILRRGEGGSGIWKIVYNGRHACIR